MKKIVNCLKNWRLWFITVTGIAALLLLSVDTIGLFDFVKTKIAGFAVLYVSLASARHWKHKGKIDEIDILIDE